jgi:hypothetical protein
MTEVAASCCSTRAVLGVGRRLHFPLARLDLTVVMVTDGMCSRLRIGDRNRRLRKANDRVPCYIRGRVPSLWVHPVAFVSFALPCLCSVCLLRALPFYFVAPLV